MSATNRRMDLSRTNSICPTPETVLLKSVKTNDTESIKTLIRENRSLLTCKYPSTKTILPLACSEKGISPSTVQALINLGADLDGNSVWKPLHLAAQNPNSLILEIIIKNIKSEQMNQTVDGNNALHSLVKGPEVKGKEESFGRNVELLVTSGVNVNDGDSKNASAILWAAQKGYKHIIKTILEKSIGHVDLDSHKLRNKTARDLIKEKNLYEGPLPEKNQYQTPNERLFALIKQSKEDAFIVYFDTPEVSGDVNLEDNTSSLLQYGCERGLAKVVKYLLDKDANVNQTSKNQKKPPIELAAESGYFEIVQMLLVRPELIISPKIMCYLSKKLDNPKFDTIGIDHEKCCKIILEKLESNKIFIDINGEDYSKNTPIHYCLRYGDQDTIQRLLKLGASLACKNDFGKMPIEDIKPDVLKNHLNDCIKFKISDKNYEKRDFEVIFDYHSLVPPRRRREKFKSESDAENCADGDKIVSETKVIAYMSQAPEFKALLIHPVIVSFLFLKWHKIRWLFYTNLLFYIFFVLSLIVYIFTYYGNFEAGEPPVFVKVLSKLSWFLLHLTFLVLMVRELFQITVSPGNYFQNFENVVEIILIVITGMILYISSPTNDTRKRLSSIAILLAAFELVLMVGQHPKLSTNVIMLKTVSLNFFKLLLWYSLLIIAFALSFYILFAKEEVPQKANATETGNDDEDSFAGPGKSLFKTIVMLTGEFDAGSMNFHTYPITSKLIFSIFVFMIPIILLNLLNGLAVSDTQTIKNDAELHGHITRARHIYYVESMLLGNILPISLMKLVQSVFCCCPCDKEMTYTFLKRLARRVCLFPNSQNCQFCVLPNDHGKIYYEFDGSPKRRKNSLLGWARSCSDMYLDKETIKRINAIIKSKRERVEDSRVANVEGLYAEINNLKMKLNEVLSTLSRVEFNFHNLTFLYR